MAAPAQGQGSETSPLENRAASADPSGASSNDVNPGRRGPRRLFPVRLRSHQPLTRRERALSPPCHQHRGAHHLPRRWVTRALGSMAGSLLTHPRFTYSLPRCQSAMLHCPFPCPSPPHPPPLPAHPFPLLPVMSNYLFPLIHQLSFLSRSFVLLSSQSSSPFFLHLFLFSIKKAP